MRTIFLTILFFLDLALFGQYSYVASPIPAGGQVAAIDSTISPKNVYVGTGGVAVNLGSNSYSIQYNGTPSYTTSFICRFDATRLTAVATNVNIFGLTPLKDYPGQGIYYILYQVEGTSNANKQVHVSYQGSMIMPGGNVNVPTIFNNKVTLYDSLHYNPNNLPVLTGAGVVALNDSGALGYGCVPWCASGNSNNPFPSFIGNIDTPDVRFRVNNIHAGLLSSNHNNTCFGVRSLLQNTTGIANTAIGHSALNANTTGDENTAIGNDVMSSVTTGNSNTAIGDATMTTNISGIQNVAVGAGSDVASGSTSNAIAIGYAIIASSNQFAVGGENESHPNMNNCAGCVMTDTTAAGTGQMVPRPLPSAQGTTFTPVTGDSISPFTENNTINPAGTIANLTIRVPGSPSDWQKLSFTTLQVVTALHWSIALNQTHSVEAHVPTSTTAGQAFAIIFNPTLGEWVNSQ